MVARRADLNQNQLVSSLVLIVSKAIKKFQPLIHNTLLLILARFSDNVPFCEASELASEEPFFEILLLFLFTNRYCRKFDRIKFEEEDIILI